MRKSPRRRCQFLCLAAAIPAFCHAATTNYTAGDAGNPTSWSQPTNWSAGEPSSTNNVVNIVATSPTAYNVNYDYTGVSVTLSTLTISQANATGTVGNQLNVASIIVTLNSTNIFVGNSGGSGGSGTINQSLGTVNFGQLTLGDQTNDHGTYNLSGGTVNNNNVANGLIVGASGTGTFAQTGGGVTLASSNGNSGLYLGYNSTGVGNYSQSTGTLVSNSFEFIGYSGTGNYNQTGGTNTTPSIMYIGFGSGSNGSYTMSNSAALSANAEFVGGASTGSFTQSGSSTNSMTELGIGGDGNVANGTYSLSGSAVLNVTGGGVEILGYGGTGTLTQSGGTNDATGSIYVGGFTPISGTGFYNLSNGQINASNGETVGNLGAGTFTQSGGNNSLSTSTSALLVGGGSGVVGTYNLSGPGQITDSGFEAVGVNGTGMFNQTGGSNTINGEDAIGANLDLGENAGSSGTYSLSGTGQLKLGPNGAFLVGNSGTGVFNQTGGSVTAPGGTVLGFMSGSNGTYTLSGTGTITTLVEQIGFEGVGVFTQTGGTNTPTEGLVVGYSVGSTGTYTLSGNGTLNTNAGEVIGQFGVGTFSQSGGTNTITGSNNLVLGSNVGASGTYNLSGGTASVGGDVIVSGAPDSAPTTSVLTVSGSGVLNVTGTTSVFSNGSSAVNLNGGTISTGGLITNGLPSLFQWTSGTLNFNTAQTFDSGAGVTSAEDGFGNSLAIGANQILTVTGNETLGGTGAFALTLNSGSIHSVSGTLNVTPTGTLTQNAGSTLYAADIVQSGGSINGVLQNQGTFTYQSGLFNGRLLNEGSVNLGPSFTAGNGIQNNTSIFLSAGQIIMANGAGLDNLGFLSLGGATLAGAGPAINDFGGTLQGYGAISSAFTNNGVLDLNGVLSFTNAAAAVNNGVIQGSGTIVGSLSNSGGTINVATGSELAISSAWTNGGLITLQGSTAVLGGGAITNTGTIQGAGDITAPIANTTGSISASGGQLELSAAGITNTAGGQIQTTSGAEVLLVQGLATNAGIISLVGGTFDNDGHALNNAGQITGYGLLRTGGLTNNGSITLTGGTTTVNGNITNSASQAINIKYNPAIFTGNITNNGTIIATDTTVTFGGSYTGNTYISDPSTNIFQNNVIVVAGGSMTGGSGDAFVFSGGTFINNGTFTNAGLLQSAEPVTNKGSFTQSGPQSWTAGTTFTNTAGTAAFDTDAGTATVSPLSIISTGGSITFNTNQHLASLAISGTGTVDVVGNELFIASTSATTIRSYIAMAYDKGTWDSPGLTSSLAESNPLKSTALGYATVGSQTVVKYTWYGDANLDGMVNSTDLTAMSHTGATWSTGDFNYDGVVNADDYSLFLLGLSESGGVNISTTVPEPAALAILGWTIGCMTTIRKPRQSRFRVR